MEGDYQRSYLFFLSGNVMGRVSNPYGNLYVMFTSDVRVCNRTVVTYELVDGYIINDFKIDHFLGHMELKMGNYGNIQIKRSLLAYMLNKLDFAKDYYDDYFCLAENRRIFSRNSVVQEMTTQIPGILTPNIKLDVRNLTNDDDDDNDIDTIVEEIVKFHEMMMDNYALKIQNDEKSIYDKLNQRISQLNRLRQNNGFGGKIEDAVVQPKRRIRHNDDFKQFLKTKISRLQIKL